MSLDVNRESIEHIGQRVDNLVFAVLVLAGLLVAFLIVELGLLVFALFNKSSKKKKKGGVSFFIFNFMEITTRIESIHSSF